MNTKWFKLMSILAVGLILAGVLAFEFTAVGNVEAAANSPVGSWKVTVTPDGLPSFLNEGIFSSDGTVTIMENTGVVGLGVWEKLSGNQYAFTVWEFFMQDGAHMQAKVTSTFTLIDKEQYTGPFFFQITAPDGSVVVEGYGNATGVRNHVEAMP
jgi:hypothetical protein